jgi:hypothetical protein
MYLSHLRVSNGRLKSFLQSCLWCHSFMKILPQKLSNWFLSFSLSLSLSLSCSCSLFTCQQFRPQIVVCFVSTHLDFVIRKIQQIKEISHCDDLIILTTSSSELLESFELSRKITASINARVVHLPYHTVEILQSKNQNVGLFTLVSPSCRPVFPLLLHHISPSTSQKKISRFDQLNFISYTIP